MKIYLAKLFFFEVEIGASCQLSTIVLYSGVSKPLDSSQLCVPGDSPHRGRHEVTYPEAAKEN